MREGKSTDDFMRIKKKRNAEVDGKEFILGEFIVEMEARVHTNKRCL